MSRELFDLLKGQLLDDEQELGLAEFSRVCSVPVERIIALAEEGVIDPLGRDPARWRFRAVAIGRARCALRLGSDLGVNDAGAALALDLLGEIRRLRTDPTHPER